MIEDQDEYTIEEARQAAFEALRDAEQLMHRYAQLLPVGDDRTKAFGCFENIRLAWRNA